MPVPEETVTHPILNIQSLSVSSIYRDPQQGCIQKCVQSALTGTTKLQSWKMKEQMTVVEDDYIESKENDGDATVTKCNVFCSIIVISAPLFSNATVSTPSFFSISD